MNPLARAIMAQAGASAPLLTLPTTNLLVALDARAGITTVSGAVSAWAGQYGTGVSAAQATAGKRPLYSTAAEFGGAAVVSADGVNDAMSLSGLSAVSGPRTFYFVVKHPDITDATNRIWLDVQTGRSSLGIRSDDYAYTDTTDRRWMATNPTTFAGRITMSFASTLATLWIGSSSQGAVTTGGEKAMGGSAGLFGWYGGTANYAQIDLAALFIYSADHDATARAAVWDYIAQEWGV